MKTGNVTAVREIKLLSSLIFMTGIKFYFYCYCCYCFVFLLITIMMVMPFAVVTAVVVNDDNKYGSGCCCF